MKLYNINRPQWYAKPQFIRKKRNHSWTGRELRKVYNMRVQRISVDLIIEKLHLEVKRTQVYNVVRMMKKNFQGRCFQCGADLTEKELKASKSKTFKTCSECKKKNLNYKKKIRNMFSRRGLCTCCGKYPSLKGRKTCMHCLSYTHRNRIAIGLCGACGREPLSRRSNALGENCLVQSPAHRKEHQPCK